MSNSLSSLDFNDNENFDIKINYLFENNGFLRIDNVFNEAEILEMKNEIEKIINKFEPSQHPKSIFTTTEENRVIFINYMVKSTPLYQCF